MLEILLQIWYNFKKVCSMAFAHCELRHQVHMNEICAFALKRSNEQWL